MNRPGALRLGTSGWQYQHWRGLLYSRELSQARWLEAYARTFDTVEVNNTFYRLPAREVFARWRERTPPDFLFALKLSRFLTHRRRLKDPGEPLARFFERAEALEEKLGPLLVQLPPHFLPDLGRLDALLACVPPKHRVSVEVRDPRWLITPVFEVLERRQAALVLHDALEAHPKIVTASFTYLRFHGGREARGGYGGRSLSAWAQWIRMRQAEGLDIYGYFNNDAGGHAVRDALRLKARLLRREGR